MRKKRFLAVVLAASMVVGNAVVASAETSTQTDTYTEVSFNETGTPIPTSQGKASGTGTLTGTTQDKVFRVVVPAQRVNTEADLFDFIMDPQGLIEKTNGAKYLSGNNDTGKLISINSAPGEGSTLYFVNSANGVKTLSNKSDEFKIINKSTMDVDVSVNAKVTSSVPASMSVSTDKTFAGYTKPSVYIGLIPTGGTEKALSANEAQVATSTIGNAKKFYVTSWNSADDYTYTIPSMNGTTPESANEYKTYGFKLTGATNGKADWVNPSPVAATATVDIVYNLSEHAGASYQLVAGGGLLVDVNLGSAKGIKSITFDGGKVLAASNYSLRVEEQQILFTKAWVESMLAAESFTSRDYTVTFDNDTTVDITLHR